MQDADESPGLRRQGSPASIDEAKGRSTRAYTTTTQMVDGMVAGMSAMADYPAINPVVPRNDLHNQTNRDHRSQTDSSGGHRETHSCLDESVPSNSFCQQQVPNVMFRGQSERDGHRRQLRLKEHVIHTPPQGK